MNHYDNVKNRLFSMANLSNSAKKKVTIDILRDAQYNIIKQLNDTLYSEYETLITQTVPDTKMYTEFSENEKKLYHYEMAMVFFTLIRLSPLLKELVGGAVALDKYNIGDGSLDPINTDSIQDLIRYYTEQAYAHLSSATNGVINSGTVEITVV